MLGLRLDNSLRIYGDRPRARSPKIDAQEKIHHHFDHTRQGG